MTAQKGTKDFETHLLNLALLSKGKVLSKDEGINIIKSNEKFNGIKEKHISSVVDAVIHLNTKFNKTWTDGYNANFEDIPEPSYGTKSAKSDIVLISEEEYFGFSVKMDEDWVVASAQNKNEFEGIFFSALMKYEEDNSIDTSSLIPYIESISNVIGKVVVRHMNPNHFDKKLNSSTPLPNIISFGFPTHPPIIGNLILIKIINQVLPITMHGKIYSCI